MICSAPRSYKLISLVPCAPRKLVIFSELSGRIDARIDEETWIPPTRKFDLIIGNMNLHWINDLEGTRRLSAALL